MMRFRHIGGFVMLTVLFISVLACGEEPPPPKPKLVTVITKPISRPESKRAPVESSAPHRQTTVTPKPQPEELESKNIKQAPVTQLPPGFEADKDLKPPSLSKAPKNFGSVPVPEVVVKKEGQMAAAATGRPDTPAATPALGVVAGNGKKNSQYDPGNRVDPFSPLLKTEQEAAPVKPKEPEVPKRVLTPLEKMNLSQIKLVAVVLMENEALAMVEEATGKGYEVRLGTYMGQNGGRVTEIRPNSIIVKERVADFRGRKSDRFQEIKIQKTENGE